MRFHQLLSTPLALVVLAGCGGGADLDLDTDIPGLRGYPQGANEACRLVSDHFAKVQDDSPRSFLEAKAVLDALIEIAEQGEASLAEVTPPPRYAGPYRRYLEARAEVLDLLEEGLKAAEDEDGEDYEEARERAEAGAEERARLARAAGLKRCARLERE